MGRNQKLRKNRKLTKRNNFPPRLDKLTIKNRPKIPPLSQVNYWLNHPSTVDWLILHWSALLNWKLMVLQDDSRCLAQTMLKELTVQLEHNLNRDCRVHYRGLPNFDVCIGINVWDWTLWTLISDLELDCHIASDQADDIDLKRAVPSLAVQSQNKHHK